MNIKDIYGNDCATLYVLSLISGKWRLPILWKLHKHKILRFNQLKREVSGITNMVLTTCLQEFEANSLIKRTQYMEIPPKVEYSLTQDGISLVLLLEELHKFGTVQLNKRNNLY